MPGSGARLYEILQELRRRRVIRVAVVYLVAAWGAIEVGETILPYVGAGDWAVTMVIVAAATGLPVALLLAWLFDFTADGVRWTRSADALAVRRWRGVIAALAFVLPVGLGVLFVGGRARAPDLDPRLVAVLPFRTAGAAPDIAWLGRGLVDVAALQLVGGDTLASAVPPMQVDRALAEHGYGGGMVPDDEQALEVARSLGASRLIIGDVIGSERQLTLSASLYDARRGRLLLRSSIVEPADSVHRIAARLAGMLAVANAKLDSARVVALTTASVPALHAYLRGEEARRRGRHREAIDAFDQAVELDSTFAAAALGLHRAQGWAASWSTRNGGRAFDIAWRHRDRLAESDRAYLEAQNPNYPGLTGPLASITAREEAVRRMPHNTDLQTLLADGYFHAGGAVGIEDPWGRAGNLFLRVVARDSLHMEALIHLHDIAVSGRDSASMRRWSDRIIAIDSTSPRAIALLQARLNGADTRGRGGPPDLDALSADQILALANTMGGPGIDEASMMRAIERAPTAEEARVLLENGLHAAVQRGRTQLAWRLLDRMPDAPRWNMLRLILPVFWAPDGTRAARAAARLERDLEGFAPSLEQAEYRYAHIRRSCLLAHRRQTFGEPEAALVAARTLLSETDRWAARVPRAGVEMDHDAARAFAQLCADAIEAAAAVENGSPDALERTARLDARLRDAPGQWEDYEAAVGLLLVRLWAELGEHEHALTASGREFTLAWFRLYSDDRLAERGPLLEQLGRREAAQRAYAHYIHRRADADSPFDASVRYARDRLIALTAEPHSDPTPSAMSP